MMLMLNGPAHRLVDSIGVYAASRYQYQEPLGSSSPLMGNATFQNSAQEFTLRN